jgi:large subunit ribosomal protein L10
LKGGKEPLAISKERKNEMLTQYDQWLGSSKALILAEYTGLTMKEMDGLRAKIREVGGEFHIVKNTLGQRAFVQAGYDAPAGFFEGSTAIVFAFQDPPAIAKAVMEFSRTADKLKVKGGYLGSQSITSDGVKSLADMPPLPVMRAQLLGTILAPASKLVRTLAEPGRQIAAVLKAYSDSESVGAAVS